jgi:hypothetical protein
LPLHFAFTDLKHLFHMPGHGLVGVERLRRRGDIPGSKEILLIFSNPVYIEVEFPGMAEE